MTLYNIDKLNEDQRVCLRLVLGHLNSKEIGRELGVSPHTVDQRLRQSMRIMGAVSRFEAARKFAETEANETYQPLIYQSSDIENSTPPVSLTEPIKQDETPVDGLMAKRSTFDSRSATLTMERAAMTSSRLPIPLYRGEKNRLSIIERFGWIIMIAIGSAVSFGGILAGLEALSRLRG